jgi:uncharacterized integral membrane protein (TIGR00698 family)
MKKDENSMKYIKGLLLVIVIGLASTGIEILISPYIQIERLTIGIVLGILYSSTIGLKENFKPGIKFALHELLKWGIVLLGFKLNFLLISELGPKIVLIIVILIPVVILGTQKLGGALKINRKVATLIGVGSSICGASAIVAMSPVINAHDDDSVLAVSVISFLGAIGVILYSSLAFVLNMTDASYGIWSGLSLQGVAHAIAAAFARGDASGEIGTIVKMTRVMMLAPLSVFLSMQFAETKEKKKAKIPLYVVLFILAGVVGTTGIIPPRVTSFLGMAGNQMILAAMIAMGLVVNLGEIRKTGLKILLHGIITFATIAVLTFVIVTLVL